MDIAASLLSPRDLSKASSRMAASIATVKTMTDMSLASTIIWIKRAYVQNPMIWKAMKNA